MGVRGCERSVGGGIDGIMSEWIRRVSGQATFFIQLSQQSSKYAIPRHIVVIVAIVATAATATATATVVVMTTVMVVIAVTAPTTTTSTAITVCHIHP